MLATSQVERHWPLHEDPGGDTPRRPRSLGVWEQVPPATKFSSYLGT
eukprot:SAG11_NODE_2607_length_3175_cov_11.018205_5_plen_47_part_00